MGHRHPSRTSQLVPRTRLRCPQEDGDGGQRNQRIGPEGDLMGTYESTPAMAAESSFGASATLDELPMLIPVPRAAQILGISRSAAYRCAACGDLPTAHLGGRVYVVTARLQALLESA